MRISIDESKARIQKLIDKYNRIKDAKRLGGYSEAKTRKDFIEPFFEALGWDVRNIEVDDEVTPEEKVSKGKVDYAFRINGIPKFFLEAKAIPIDLDKTRWAIQAINYAYHKGVTWAILSDFEGTKVFNSERRTPDPYFSRFIDLKYNQYIENFEQLWLLSRESFEERLIDREAEKWGKKLKKIPIKETIDKQLLSDFTEFRELLSKDVVKYNRDKLLSREDVDEAIQRILNRVIFIRKCEDNEIEPIKLKSTIRIWGDSKKGFLYDRITEIFRYYEREYDSELFEFSFCDQLKISDRIISEVILGLYRTRDKAIYYDFSAIGADVLGNIYEQYLGHILRKTPKRAKVEKRYKRRKEMGIYYTPTYIVEYIVKNTVGELLKDKKFKADDIRILDPACGSGSFLIKAFDYLNAFHGRREKGLTQAHLDLSGAGAIYSKKVKILKDNIFGVDLDPKSVEIAQLNLLLKTLEKKHRLPMLKENIKCGNSLIDDEDIAGKKSFKWGEEFGEIMDDEGFDVIIGNPPYIELRTIDSEIRKYFFKNYEIATKKIDVYAFFIGKCIKMLKEGGFLGFITSNTWLMQESFLVLRSFILENCLVRKLIITPKKTFKDATVETTIIILEKCSGDKKERLRNGNKIQYFVNYLGKSA